MKRTLFVAALPLIFLTLTTAWAGQGTVKSGGQPIAVTFDDLPFVRIERLEQGRVERQFSRLLKALIDADVPAVGFVNEYKLYRKEQLDASRVALLQQWLDTGMELGNHTYAHLSLNKAGINAFEADILRGERISRNLTEKKGEVLRYFRFPFLHVGLDMQTRRQAERFLSKHGYTSAPVTILSQEWMYAAAYDNAERNGDKNICIRIGQAYLDHMSQAITHAESLAQEMFGRNISQVLLLHANTLNAEYFPALAEMIRKRGYRFATLDEVLQDRAYGTPDTYVGSRGDSWLYHWLQSAGIRPESGPTSPDFIKKLAGINGYRGY